jgi:hypothetical protein
MPEKTIAYCGLDCAACPAFHAAERQTLEQRQKTADDWSKQFNHQFKAEDIDCVGCSVREGKHIGYCAMCEIRLCALGKGKAIVTCADCPEYGCAKLEGFLKNVPQARANLETLRS